MLLDRVITLIKYNEALKLDISSSHLYNVLDYIEHMFVYREMTAFGLRNTVIIDGLHELMGAVSYQPAGLCRRIVGLMGWLQACFCFPQELKAFAAARLLEVDLFDDARKLGATVGPLLEKDRIQLIIESLKMIGFRPQHVTLGRYQRNDGKWRQNWFGLSEVRPKETRNL